MPKVFPFKCVRPRPDLASKVSARIHGNETNEDQIKFVQDNPLTYLNVIKPQLHFADSKKNPEKHFDYARKKFESFLNEGTLVRDDREVLFVYSQKYPDGFECTGIIATLLSSDYMNNVIKKHENTRKAKEEMLVEHISATGAIGEPVLVSCSGGKELSKLMQDAKSNPALYDFTSGDKVNHKIWEINEGDDFNKLTSLLEGDENFYIADGHHRSAASSLYHKLNNNSQGRFLTYLMPEDQLKILPFHRLMTLESPIDESEFVATLEDNFDVQRLEKPFSPASKGEMGMCFNGSWFSLKLTAERSAEDELDVDLLENQILKPLLGVEDSRTDSRLDYVAGNESYDGDSCATNYDVVFTLAPMHFEEVRKVADANKTMPPKSTWILPKLRSGLFIQEV
jgi:uncharacterized protein (DUF1015 family)